VACACLDTSAVASLQQTSTRQQAKTFYKIKWAKRRSHAKAKVNRLFSLPT